MKLGFDYTQEYFRKCCMSSESYVVHSSDNWSDDPWFIDQEKRDFIKNSGFWLINEGLASGRIVGGNLITLHC